MVEATVGLLHFLIPRETFHILFHKVIAVLDATKFNRRGFNQVLPMEKINCVITDDSISKQDKSALAQTGVELLVV